MAMTGLNDRSTWLAVVGLMVAAIGLLMMGRAATVRVEAMNIAVGVALTWCGVATVMGQKWVRPVMVATLAFYLVGVLTNVPAIIYQWVVNPRQKSPGSLVASAVLGTLVLLGIPALLLRFYLREDVRAKLEMTDTGRRWTDGQPLPLVAAVLLMLWTAIGAVASLASGVPPLGFEMPLLAAIAWATLTAGASVAAGVGLLRGRRWAWVTAVTLVLIAGIVSLVMQVRIATAPTPPVQVPEPVSQQLDRLREGGWWGVQKTAVMFAAEIALLAWCSRHMEQRRRTRRRIGG